MSRFLRTNTATRITVGPFLDPSDGVTPVTSLTVTSCHLTLMVDTGGVPTLALDADATASAGDNDMVHVTNDNAGFFDLELTTGNTNYLGRAMLAITDAANHCPVFHEFTIVPAMIYDSLILGTDRLDTNVTHINDVAGTSVTAINANLGTTQPINFTGTAGSALAKADMVDVAGAAVSTSAAQIGVNAVNVGGTAQTGLDIGANVTTLINRIGAFTGSGVNTILGFFKALFSSDASTPSDIGGTYDPATMSLEAFQGNAISVSDITTGIFDASTAFGKSTGGIVAGTVDDSAFSPTTTAFESNDVTDTTADTWKSIMGIFTPATTTTALRRVRFLITAYSKQASNGRFTVTMMGGGNLPSAPVDGDTFILV